MARLKYPFPDQGTLDDLVAARSTWPTFLRTLGSSPLKGSLLKHVRLILTIGLALAALAFIGCEDDEPAPSRNYYGGGSSGSSGGSSGSSGGSGYSSGASRSTPTAEAWGSKPDTSQRGTDACEEAFLACGRGRCADWDRLTDNGRSSRCDHVIEAYYGD